MFYDINKPVDRYKISHAVFMLYPGFERSYRNYVLQGRTGQDARHTVDAALGVFPLPDEPGSYLADLYLFRKELMDKDLSAMVTAMLPSELSSRIENLQTEYWLSQGRETETDVIVDEALTPDLARQLRVPLGVCTFGREVVGWKRPTETNIAVYNMRTIRTRTFLEIARKTVSDVGYRAMLFG
jgi:hypothetical protein